MSIWDRIQELISNRDEKILDPTKYAIIDTEVGTKDHKIHDIGAVRFDEQIYHGNNKSELFSFINDVDFICGHNIINHDAKYIFGDENSKWELIDTLYVSPLLFPERPYHKLLKDDKILTDELNNPVNDCYKAQDLLLDEVEQWLSLPTDKKKIYIALLLDKKEFKGFITFAEKDKELLREYTNTETADLIKSCYRSKICQNTDIEDIISSQPIELAYALALADTTDYRSITPGWVIHNFPNVENIIIRLRHTLCDEGCEYCNSKLNIYTNLKTFFGYDKFREYEGEPLQELAVKAAVNRESLLAIFPTGGGKSLTFQLPAIIEGRTVHGLTVVISPLQSLMKDQVDNLANKGISDAVTINGLLDPISRSNAIQRVLDGDASILYIAPEMLRSKTIERILLVRHVVRFVIDEAHCFSAWGQDFRVDYLYIGKFISEYQKKKQYGTTIPVSCFTATAKPKVIQDICDYFNKTLDIDLKLYASKASRTNLKYSVIHSETDDDKYTRLRSLITESSCPTIVYVSRTQRAVDLAKKLERDGFDALPYHGKMDNDEKIKNQEAFMNDQARIIVATSAFGMGVDKSDVGLVVHYDISDSLENYVQEAGRAGRNPMLKAKCYVLFNEDDLNKHFILLNQTKLSISEIQQVWKAIKELTKHKEKTSSSALEIARKAGWDDSVSDIETRVRTAISALEQGGYLERGNNIPHVYATGITVKNLEEARKRITDSILFDNEDIEKAVRIIKSLISKKNISKAQDSDAETRIDYLADTLGISKNDVISIIGRMRQEGILADSMDISAFLIDSDSAKRSQMLVDKFSALERYILGRISNSSLKTTYKQLNDEAVNSGIKNSCEKDIKTLLFFLNIKGYTFKKNDGMNNMEIVRKKDYNTTISQFQKRIEIAKLIVDYLYEIAKDRAKEEGKTQAVQFSVLEVLDKIRKSGGFILSGIQIEDVEEALLYLSKIEALKLEGGFLVLYNAMQIRRIKANKFQYKQDDYRILNEFYKQKIQQIHIVGEYANLMVKDYDAAMLYVKDYFQMDYKKFISKYFKGERQAQIERNITPRKYEQLFGTLSERQMEIIQDKESRCIVVAAGPGSGKTRVLVHKLASLLLLEDVKHEQLLMLTFSRAAATEFKQRLMSLIGNAAHFIEIKTFHSYCFDLLGRIGNLEDAGNVVIQAAEMIEKGDVEPNRIGKTVLVIDEAQDMSRDEYALVNALMTANENMRVIAVGDDDQNIYEFRGSDSRHMQMLTNVEGSRFVEMTENYRSHRHIVNTANTFSAYIQNRLKKSPILSMTNLEGYVSVTKHKSLLMYEPLANELCQNLQTNKESKETTCVLTQTNEEAVIMVALLRKKGLKCKLIQSMEGIRFINLAEMRYFLKCIDEKITTPLINDELWEYAKTNTYTAYSNSEALIYVTRCIEGFESTNKSKYYSDFKEYVFESSIEDFDIFSADDIVVSTIHKSKGREFDNVYMLVSGGHSIDNSMLKRYYVAITRAKKNLYIHTNSNIFDNINPDRYTKDEQVYYMPDEVALQLSHRDVNLGFFKNIKKEVLRLRGGYKLGFSFPYLLSNTCTPIAMLSKNMQQTITDWNNKGYVVTECKTRFIVAWKPKDADKDEPETAVILADISLKKI